MPQRPMMRYLLPLLCGAALAAGCSRTSYRLKADHDAYGAILGNVLRTRDAQLDYNIYVPPDSRMYDPFDPDHEPMPPDDPTSHEYMHYVDQMKGWKHWHDHGDTPFVENPKWRAYLFLDEDGCLVLSHEEALRLARLNSRDYQSQLESLYLSALDVTFERFRFDAQFFAGHQIQFTADGPERRGAGGESSSELLVATLPAGQDGIRMEKMFAAGGQLVVGLANSLVWEFSGPDTQTAATLASFAFLQPLLRNGGKARVLERLTLAERTLLANVRQMERYKRGFYVEIITGQPAGQGPSRRGGVFGGSGLEGFTGVGGGGFGRLTGGAGGFGGDGAGAGQAGGFLGLLQEQQNIRNLEFNVAGLRANLQRLQAIADAEHPDPGEQLRAKLQVEQAEQALYSAQSRLLNAKRDCLNNLDAYKVNLGLPPDLCVKVRDPWLDQFELIDDSLLTLQNRLTEIQREIGRINVQFREEAPRDARTFTWEEKHRRPLDQLKKLVAEMVAARAQLEAGLTALESAGCPEAIRRRRERFEELRQRYKSRPLGGQDPCLDEQGEERLKQQVRELLATDYLDQTLTELEKDRRSLEEDVGKQTAQLEAVAANIDRLLANVDRMTPEEIYDALFGFFGAEDDDPARRGVFHATDVLADLSVAALELSLVTAKQRAMCIDLPTVDLEPPVAFEIARANRRDWMNARANLVDAWRSIEFVANELDARLDVFFEGDIQNVGDNPLNLQGTTGRLRTRMEFDAPLTRLAERNRYREALIGYQQARRGYYAFTDQVDRSLRSTLRAIEINEINFEARRRAVLAAIDQVVTNRLIQDQPAPPGEVRQVGVTAARDAVSALTDLLNAQDDFLSVWVNYEVLRRALDRDLGTMQLDAFGNWIDPGDFGSQSGFLLPADCDDCRLEADIFGLPLPEDVFPPAPEELPAGELVDPASYLQAPPENRMRGSNPTSEDLVIPLPQRPR